MPCSVSTAASEAAPAPVASVAQRASAPRSLASRTSRVIPLADGLVEPLVIKGAFQRVQLVPEVLSVRCGRAGVEGLAVAPRLDQGKVVGVTVPLQHFETQIAVVFARGIRLRLDELDCLILSSREDVDMG